MNFQKNMYYIKAKLHNLYITKLISTYQAIEIYS